MNLQNVLQRTDVWRGGVASSARGLSTGFPALDALIPSGWPEAALTEIIYSRPGIGELQLLTPLLARLSQQERWLAFIAPPYIPYAPALRAAGINLERVLLVHPRTRKDQLWSLEVALREGTCSAVLAWPGTLEFSLLRRLQLAAEAGESLGILFRPPTAEVETSPAALRLKLAPATTGLDVTVLKRRGGWPVGPARIEVSNALARSLSATVGARNFRAGR
ncbi:MAG: translesion DNA synthesis-associated protein ImuA [Gammaproteobacteria bacterium]|nr:translesion DNA synthesis-associated protein ImuA [Gammaproteobacteria bacterium]